MSPFDDVPSYTKTLREMLGTKSARMRLEVYEQQRTPGLHELEKDVAVAYSSLLSCHYIGKQKAVHSHSSRIHAM